MTKDSLINAVLDWYDEGLKKIENERNENFQSAVTAFDVLEVNMKYIEDQDDLRKAFIAKLKELLCNQTIACPPKSREIEKRKGGLNESV